MTDTHDTTVGEPKRGILARPLDALIFLLPLLVFYEVASLRCPDRVIAFNMLHGFFELFGPVGRLTPGLAVVVILLATHGASGEPWRIHWRISAAMYVEAAILSVPLFALNWAVPLSATADCATGAFSELAYGVGAGIYEELVFRLAMISIIMLVGVDIFRLPPSGVAVAAIVASALLFSAHHHHPIGSEAFDSVRFAFRSAAGIYLALVFWFRGYGAASGCHVAYNVGLVTIDLLH